MAYKRGPSTLPYGMLDVQLTGKDCSAPTATYCIRSVTKDCSQLRAVTWMLKSREIQSSKMLWSTVLIEYS